MIDVPSCELCCISATWLVWMSAAGTPAPLIAAITAAAASLFCASALVAVFPRVSTVKLNVARSGTLVTLPVPVTVMVLSAAVAEWPSRGCAMPLTAEAVSRSSARTMIQRSLVFMPCIRRRARRTSHGMQVLFRDSRNEIEGHALALGGDERVVALVQLEAR